MRATATLLLLGLAAMSLAAMAEARSRRGRGASRPAQALFELQGRPLHVRAAPKSLQMEAAPVGPAGVRARRSDGRRADAWRPVQQYLVRVQHPAPAGLPSFLGEVSEGGFLRYLPHDTFVLALDGAALQKVAAADGVVEAFVLPPAMKIEPDIFKLIAAKASVGGNAKSRAEDQDFLTVMGVGQRKSGASDSPAQRRRLLDATPSSTLTLLVLLAVGKHETPASRAAKLSLMRQWERAFTDELQLSAASVALVSKGKAAVTLNGSPRALKKAVTWLAKKAKVHWVQEYKQPHLLNMNANYAMQSWNASTHHIWDHGITGEGQVVGVADTGIDYDNCLFHDPAMPTPPRCSGKGYVEVAGCINPNHRKIITYRKFDESNYDDYYGGHGTHVAGSVAGSAVGTDAEHEQAARYNGAAPGAKLAFDDVGDAQGSLSGIPYDLEEGLFPHSYAAGARLHSNSWGTTSIYYDSMSMEIDEFSYTHDDFLVLVAAGNDGPYGYTVGAPATAKNILSVGALENAESSAEASMPRYLRVSMGDSEFVYGFSPADFGASLVSGSTWSGDIVHAAPADACGPLSGVTGKIVLIIRGSCEFGTKALNAQNAGAIAVVVYNNQPGTLTMSGGTQGAQVTVPAIMISAAAGEEVAGLFVQMYGSSAASDAATVAPRSTVMAAFPVASGQEDAREMKHHVIAGFSSRGPTGDLRIKPDVLCPGSGIVSALGDADVTSNNCGSSATTAMSGTSMATPLCAGAAALVREYLNKGYWHAGVADTTKVMDPSAALVKAVMIHSAQPVKTDAASAYLERYPNPQSGYGRVDLSSALAFPDSGFQTIFEDYHMVAQGNKLSFCFFVQQHSPRPYIGTPASQGEMRVSLVWTDPAGDPMSSRILINDLDLQVFAEGTEAYLGNDLTQSDQSHTGYKVRDSNGNAEQVRIKDAPQGLYMARVLGIDVPVGPQSFALVASAAQISPRPLSDCQSADVGQGCPNSCSGRGQCVADLGVCECPITHGGSDCSREYLVLGSTPGTADALSVTSLGMAYYTFTVPTGGGFELVLSSSTAPVTDADYVISRGSLPTDTSYGAGIIDEYSDGSFSGSGGGTWVLGVLSWAGDLSVDATLTLLPTGLGADGQVSGNSGGGGGGGGGGEGGGGSNCTVADCNCGLFTANTGSFSDGQGDYPNEASCWWIIAPPLANNVSVTFTDVDFEQDYDFLYVYECQDVWCQQKQRIWTHSGYTRHKRLLSNTGIIMIKMSTDVSMTESGFTAVWKADDPLHGEDGDDGDDGNGCGDDGLGRRRRSGRRGARRGADAHDVNWGSGWDWEWGSGWDWEWGSGYGWDWEWGSGSGWGSGCDDEDGGSGGDGGGGGGECAPPCECQLLQAPQGSFSDGSVGGTNYNNNADCRWIIAPQSSLSTPFLVLKFSEMDVEADYDFVIINECSGLAYDSTDPAALPTCQDPVQIAELSGYISSDSLASAYYTSSTGIMEVRLTSDQSITSDGFSASWELSATEPFTCTAPCACGQFAQEEGSFSDGSGGESYSNNADCRWKILSPSRQSVRLRFTAFGTEADYDYVMRVCVCVCVCVCV